MGNYSLAKQIYWEGIQRTLHGRSSPNLSSSTHNQQQPQYYKRDVEESTVYLFHSLGMLEYSKFKQYPSAKQLFVKALTLFPNNSQIALGLALVLSKDIETIDQAREYYRRSVSIDPNHVHAWQSWAVFEKHLRNYDRARSLFKNGLRYDPNHGPLWQAYALMEIELGYDDLGRSLLKESVVRAPYHAPSYQAWACLEVKLGNFVKAKELVLQGLQRCPKDAPLWSTAMIVEQRLGNLEQARQLGYTAIRLFPRYVL